ncbi:hypothetical protein [Aliivibrio logei]|uniref:hypothetical protein n=1 Tax=Aliivibrio logei TaxID=688 RepID=UPI0035C8BDC0
MSMTKRDIEEAIIIITSMRKSAKKTTNIIHPETKNRVNQKIYELELKEINQNHDYLSFN